MRELDFSPLLQFGVGFDDMFRLTDSLRRLDGDRSYPPYNIERIDENDYRITMALAGFTEDDLDITVEDDTLTVTGSAQEETGEEDEKTYLYRGIARRAFERKFQLADTIKVKDASFENGLLNIELEREIPEHKRPRQIAINGNTGTKRIRGEKAKKAA